jgi:hypothetical protein
VYSHVCDRWSAGTLRTSRNVLVTIEAIDVERLLYFPIMSPLLNVDACALVIIDCTHLSSLVGRSR